MSLRTRLFLGIGSLVTLLVLAQAFWVRRLADELSAEVDQVAFEVGHRVVSHLTVRSAPCAEGETCDNEEVFLLPDPPPKGAKIVERQVRVMALPDDADAAPTNDGSAYRFEVRIDHQGGDGEKVEERHWKWIGSREEHERILKLHGPDHRVREIPIPSAGLRDKLEHFQQRQLWSSAGFLVAGLLLAAFVAQGVAAPLGRLTEAAREVGDGALGTQVPAAAPGEVGAALTAFNRMSTRLAELDRKNRELRSRQHLGEIGEIARGLAHSLRNPLNALGLSVEELATRSAARSSARSSVHPDGADGGDPGDDEAERLAASARRQIRRLDGSIRSFLALASQGGGAAADVDVGELLRDVALEALQDASRGVRLEVEAAGSAAPLRAVEAELRAVLQALLVNAVEASPADGEVRIRIRPAAGPGEGAEGVEIEIDDAGPGLPAEVRERLFTPHVTTKANGSGMGLFLAHRIATTRYGGRLELTDRSPRGTRALLELGPRREDGEP